MTYTLSPVLRLVLSARRRANATALLLGLRQGEALGLRWSDVGGMEKLGAGTNVVNHSRSGSYRRDMPAAFGEPSLRPASPLTSDNRTATESVYGDASETARDSTVPAESHTLRQPSASAAIPAWRRGLSVHRGIDR